MRFLINRDEYHAQELVFVDECGINLQMAREVGWSKKGKRLYDSKPAEFRKNYTVLGALHWDGLKELMMIEGGTSSDVFYEFVRQVLLPNMEPGQVVVLDNLAAHKSKRTVELLGDHGIHLLYTPPYSPEWNPIEWAWSPVKTYLRRVAQRSLEGLETALVQAADLILPEHAQNMIRECGYHTPELSL